MVSLWAEQRCVLGVSSQLNNDQPKVALFELTPVDIHHYTKLPLGYDPQGHLAFTAAAMCTSM